MNVILKKKGMVMSQARVSLIIRSIVKKLVSDTYMYM